MSQPGLKHVYTRGILALGKVPSAIRGAQASEVTLDLSGLRWITPEHLAAIRCHIELTTTLGKTCTIVPPADSDAMSYCGRMGLFEGTTYVYPFSKHDSPNFLPLMRIATDDNHEINTQLHRVFAGCGATANYIDRLSEAFTELADNIYWHADMTPRLGWGYIQAQAYLQKGRIKIALVDTGIGFYQSYVRTCQTRNRSEAQIIRDAFTLGESSLNPNPAKPERGVGLYETWEFIKRQTGWLRVSSGGSWVTVTQVEMHSGPLTRAVDGTIIEMEVPIL